MLRSLEGIDPVMRALVRARKILGHAPLRGLRPLISYCQNAAVKQYIIYCVMMVINKNGIAKEYG